MAVVIDAIYLGTLAGQVLENFDLERVEILRGPQGTLFGKNTVGGVVNVIRSRPTGEFGGKFKLTGGEDGQAEARLVVNTAITDNVALKVFGTKIEYDGFMTNVTTGNGVAAKDYSNVGATLLLRVGTISRRCSPLKGSTMKERSMPTTRTTIRPPASFPRHLLDQRRMTLAAAF